MEIHEVNLQEQEGDNTGPFDGANALNRKCFRNSFKLAAKDPASEKIFVLLYNDKILIIDKNMPDLERVQRAGDICKIEDLDKLEHEGHSTGIYCH